MRSFPMLLHAPSRPYPRSPLHSLPVSTAFFATRAYLSLLPFEPHRNPSHAARLAEAASQWMR
jgi:hypothetical protein